MAKFYSRVANLLQAIRNCQQSGNKEWEEKHSEKLAAILREHLPSGAGFDNGTTLSERSTPERLIFDTAFHHMNDAGMYDGWTNHTVSVQASLLHGIIITSITGPNRNDIKDFIGSIFADLASVEVE